MPRERIGLQHELSTTPGSVVVTDVTNAQFYLTPGAAGQVLTIVGGVPAWANDVDPDEFQQYANFAAFPPVGLADVIYLDQAANVFYIWNGAAYVQVPAAAAFSITGAGNSGPNQAITNGQTVNWLAVNGFTVVASAPRTFTLTPPVGAATGQVLTWNNGTSTWAAQTPATTFQVAGSSGPNQTITIGADTLSILGGTNITTVASATDTVTINMTPFSIDFLSDVDTTTLAPVNNNIMRFDGTNWVPVNGCTWLGNFSIDCLSDVIITAPTAGDVIEYNGTNWVNIPAGGGGTMSSWLFVGSSGAVQTVTNGQTVNFLQGAGMTVASSNTRNLTISYSGSLNNNSDVLIAAPAANEILAFVGGKWVNTNMCTELGNFSIDCLGDVISAGAVNNNLLQFNGTNWVVKTPCQVFATATIGCISDVILTAPTNGQVLTFNGTNWVNQTDVDFITAVANTNTVNLTVTGTTLTADVQFSATAGNVAHNVTGVAVIPKIDSFSPVTGTGTLTLSSTPLAGSFVQVYRNGVLQRVVTDYTIAGAVITLVVATGASTGATYSETFDVIYYV